MKRVWLFALLTAASLTGCGYTKEQPTEASFSMTETVSRTEQQQTAERSRITEPVSFSHEEIQNMEEVNTAVRKILSETEEAVLDITLTSEKREILIGSDDPKLIFCAVPQTDFNPQTIQLVNADTGEILCDLFDDCNFEEHGDDIKGDGWYTNRYTLNTDIGKDPAVSEGAVFRFYAECRENNILHRSEPIEILVAEPFSDKELDDQERVNEALHALMDSDAWKQADTETRRSLALDCLKALAGQGLIEEDSIYANEDIVTFSHISGINAGIQLTPFDPLMN